MPELKISSAVAVANWMIKKNLEDPSGLTHLKIQKLLYFAQGWHLAYFSEPLFSDSIEAWKHGPVVKSVYLKLSRFKDNVITALITEPVATDGGWKNGTPEIRFHSEDTKWLLESVWDNDSKTDAWKLVAASHAKGGPWEQTKALAGDDAWGYPIISLEMMKEYFESQLKLANIDG
ncbi:MAG: DUF4065 domain-containing protein [Deltaproteobacteria bacterium]|jgi:uncharacterized phage-associated protein|nr:DUF4065 domain-containing protein [Deltaproteobacteria bacterium]